MKCGREGRYEPAFPVRFFDVTMQTGSWLSILDHADLATSFQPCELRIIRLLQASASSLWRLLDVCKSVAFCMRPLWDSETI